MYFIYVSSDRDTISLFESVLLDVDGNKSLHSVSNGYELISYLQNIKQGESYPELIILTPKTQRLSTEEVLELLKTDDIYCLIPVLMLVPEKNASDNALCIRYGADIMVAPKMRHEWAETARKICASCS